MQEIADFSELGRFLDVPVRYYSAGMLVRLVKYPAGVINPRHTHPCGHGMYVLEGTLVTHKGNFGPGSFVWFPEGEVMEHGASGAGDVTVVFITNKPFEIHYR